MSWKRGFCQFNWRCGTRRRICVVHLLPRGPGHISSKRRCQSKRQQFLPRCSLALNPTPDLVLAPPSPLLPTAAGLPVASSCLLSCLSPDFLFLSAPKIGAEAKALCPRTYPAPLLGKKDEIRWKGIQKRSHNRRSNGSFEIQGDARDRQHECGQGRSGRPEVVL